MMFQTKSVGIDARADSIRIAVAVSQGGRTKILNLIEREIPTNAEGETTDATEILKEALKEVGANEDLCVAGIPTSNSINRLLSTPLTDSSKIRQTLKFQLEPQIPYPIDQVISDFVTVRKSDEGSDILAIAVAKDSIAEKLRHLRSAGVDPQILALDALALSALYFTPFDFSEDRVTALLLTGEESSFLGFFVGERLIGYRNLEGVPRDDIGAVDNMIKELKRSLVGFTPVTDQDAEIGALCVGGSNAEFIREYIQREIRDLPMRSIDFNEKAIVEIPPEFYEHVEDFRLAIALAHAGLDSSANAVNFMREEYAPPSVISRMLPNIKLSLIVLGVALVVWFAGVWAQIYGQSKRLEALNEEMVEIFSSTMPGIESASDAERQIKQEKEKFKTLTNYSSEYVSPIDVLEEVAAAAPKNASLTLNDLSSSDNVLRMTGLVDSFDDIDAFKKQIEISPIFSDVTIDSATKSEKMKKVTFRIRAEISRHESPGAVPDDGGGS